MKKQMCYAVSAALVILCGLATAQVKMTKPLAIDMTYDIASAAGSQGFESITMSFNYDTKKKAASNSASVRPDIAISSVYVGLASVIDWGIYCNEQTTGTNSTNNCLYDGTDKPTFSYMGTTFSTFRNAQGYLGFSSDIQQRSPATLNLITGPDSNSSPLKDSGIIGLSPLQGNDLWKSLFSEYSFSNGKLPSNQQSDFSFSLMYYLNKPDSKWDGQDADTWKYSTFWANGWDESRVDDTKPTLAFRANVANGNTWSLSAASITVGTPQVSGGVCLYNAANSMFLLAPADATLLKTKLCGGQASCSYSSNLPNITLAITNDVSGNSLNIILTPSDYGYADNAGMLQISQTNIQTGQQQIACGNNRFGLGRLFFAKTLVYFSVGANGANPTIYLSQMLPFDKITSGERLVLFFFGLVLILAIIGTVVYKATRKEDSDGYREANNA